ncbi:T9SS type A sorting domain-containing protein [Larkinella soli]|uniref:T9SS type A sorting domain-containing protein n=1 Tax=Larkinella soli TaxID=1770527 RepID=UPI000FFBC5DC|nr:T9SS type A sorting domain-containing protein [Larkinella soli]
MKKLFTVVCFLILHKLQAQSGGGAFSFRYDTGPVVRVNGRVLNNPWAGGINGAQYSTIHLNTDPVEDLVIYDRQTSRILTFLAEKQADGTFLWRYTPQYEEQFPPITLGTWMLLVDYDHDGKKDLFSHTNGGLRIMQNTSSNGRLSWKTIADPVYHEGLSGTLNLYISSTDVPAILDVDDDGDIDILSYDINGSTANLFQNMSVERKKDPNGLDFKRIGFCWGNFKSNDDCNDFTFGLDCVYVGNGAEGDPSGARVMHNGNSMLLIDLDGDGKRDLLTAHVTCPNVSQLNNVGENGAGARFAGVLTRFPAGNAIQFEIFPALYSEDLDFDGVKDLVASVNTYANDGNLIDFKASNWFYKNKGTNKRPDFQYVTKSFLQEDMIDFGEAAAPVLADLDGDGDLDLLVGNAGTRDGRGFRARLAQFENVGSRTKAEFELKTDDYLNLERLQLINLKPAVADIDGNGSPDLVFTGVSTSRTAEIRYLLNTAPRGTAFQLDGNNIRQLPTPDRFGITDVPTWYDVDRDGRSDLLIGKQNGSIEYHRNTGTAAAPKYELQEQNYGRLYVQPGANSPSLAVVDFNGDLQPELLTGTRDGFLKLYQLPEQPGSPMQLLDSTLVINELTQTSDRATPGGNLLLTAGDLNGDGLAELLAGTTAGGVRFLRNTSTKVVVTGIDDEVRNPWAYPNPTDRFLRIYAPENGVVDVLNGKGQPVTPRLSVKAYTEATLDLGTLPQGIYLVRLMRDGRAVMTRKVVLTK